MILAPFGPVLCPKKILISYQLRKTFGLAGIFFSSQALETCCNTHMLLFIATLSCKGQKLLLLVLRYFLWAEGQEKHYGVVTVSSFLERTVS